MIQKILSGLLEEKYSSDLISKRSEKIWLQNNNFLFQQLNLLNAQEINNEVKKKQIVSWVN